MDTKKKELVGEYPNGGRSGGRQGDPERSTSTTSPTRGRQGDPVRDLRPGPGPGWVNVGVDHDTAGFAVKTIRRGGTARSGAYPQADRLLIGADSGGTNGYRVRLWKAELQAFAAENGLAVTVCHFPPGTSKWNKIEHRLFSQITMNWRGGP